jgi:hypothetical protein
VLSCTSVKALYGVGMVRVKLKPGVIREGLFSLPTICEIKYVSGASRKRILMIRKKVR